MKDQYQNQYLNYEGIPSQYLARSMQIPIQNKAINHSSLSPYGIAFGEEEKVRKIEQQKYKEDLDYLCSLKQKRKEMEDNSILSRQIQFMNDKYNYDRLSQQSVIKHLNQYNYQTALDKQRQNCETKRELHNEYIENRNRNQRQAEIEKELTRQRKAKLLNELQTDLNDFNNKKDQEAKTKLEEKMHNQTLLNEETYRFHSPYQQYKTKINQMNKRIYDRSKLYNGYFNSPVDDEFFNAKNDFEFNRKIAEKREREKIQRRLDQTQITKRQEDLKRLQDEDEHLKALKIKNQNNYKDYLDSQNVERSNRSIVQRNQQQESQLIMPSYNYPNYPIPMTKKAYDTLQNVHLTSPSPDLTRNKDRYLGESVLRHNPITCPIDDVEYNKYVLNDLFHINSNANQNTRNNIDNFLANNGGRIISPNPQ